MYKSLYENFLCNLKWKDVNYHDPKEGLNNMAHTNVNMSPMDSTERICADQFGQRCTVWLGVNLNTVSYVYVSERKQMVGNNFKMWDLCIRPV